MASAESPGKSVAVIGAGFSGLVSAYYLARAGFTVEIFEATRRTGGLIGTISKPQGLVETAANGLLNSVLVEDLFTDLELPLLITKKEARKRFIFRAGEARRWPLGLRASLRLIRFLITFFVSRSRVAPHAEETASRWAERVLGEEAAHYFVEAALQGIYAGDPGRMSASLIFGRFFVRTDEKTRRPRVRGTVSAPLGMGQLIAKLEEKLKALGCIFHYESNFSFDDTSARPTVVATSATDAARLLRKAAPARARLLDKVELVAVTTATLFFDRTDASTKGFGCLFPPIENRKALGVLKNDFIFEGRAKRDLHSETWILGGARAPEGFDEWNDRDVVETIIAERTKVFHLSDEPMDVTITRWREAIPHYTIELERAVPTLNAADDNVWLVGNYLGQIGLSKILERASRLPKEIEARGRWR